MAMLNDMPNDYNVPLISHIQYIYGYRQRPYIIEIMHSYTVYLCDAYLDTPYARY